MCEKNTSLIVYSSLYTANILNQIQIFAHFEVVQCVSGI
jgi:hypothetical protein